MNRFSRAAVVVAGAGALTFGGLSVGATDAGATAPSTPSARQAFANSVVLNATLTASVPVKTVTTLPLFGAPLTVDVTSGPGGTLSSIDVTPANGLTATGVQPSKVRFVNTDGTAKVEVSSQHGGQNVEARAGQLSDVSGPGIWNGDVFGTGTPTTVHFTTGADSSGAPTITGVTSSDASAQIGSVEVGPHDGSQQASVNVKFTSGIQSRVLTIQVTVGTHDGDSQAKVTVALSRLLGTSLPAADVAGPQVWKGVLCDGTAASVNYTVNADGSISGAAATPTADIQQRSTNGIGVTFSDHERVSIRVQTSPDAKLRVSVDERIRCDASSPAVNTPVSTTIPDDHGDAGAPHGSGNDGASTDDPANHDAGDDHGTDASVPPSSVVQGAAPSSTVDDHGDAGSGSGGAAGGHHGPGDGAGGAGGAAGDGNGHDGGSHG